ncbi:MAG: ribosome biogenesis GTPase Der [Deltaproteobacteria bacterium]|nr:ribosome biogenesis GTPase Der [Deltaproteobacteria bacterium]
MKLVAIVGRPNVGKSTLFNRLVGRRAAIVEDVPGVTRDRNYAEANWEGRRFTVVDTGGFESDPADVCVARVGAQAWLAADEADVVLFVVDAREGLLPGDDDLAHYLRTREADVVVVANKVDAERLEGAALEFHQLGFPDVVAVSAEHGRGMDDLLEALEGRIPPEGDVCEEGERAVRVAVLGRPNVGKSSLVNRLLGEDRLLVSPTAGTTRDSIDTPLRAEGREYLLIDTAGIRRKSRIEENVERWSVARALRSIERADVCVVLLDACEGLTDQDARILHLVEKAGKGAVLGLNKWDAVEKDEKTFDRTVRDLKDRLGARAYLPILSLSALTGLRVAKLFELVDHVHSEWRKRIPTSQLNDFLEGVLRALPPPPVGGKRARIYYMTQVRCAPPVFAAFTSYVSGFPEAYQRYLLGRMREAFGFEGVPVTIRFRQRRGEG